MISDRGVGSFAYVLCQNLSNLKWQIAAWRVVDQTSRLLIDLVTIFLTVSSQKMNHLWMFFYHEAEESSQGRFLENGSGTTQVRIITPKMCHAFSVLEQQRTNWLSSHGFLGQNSHNECALFCRNVNKSIIRSPKISATKKILHNALIYTEMIMKKILKWKIMPLLTKSPSLWLLSFPPFEEIFVWTET